MMPTMVKNPFKFEMGETVIYNGDMGKVSKRLRYSDGEPFYYIEFNDGCHGAVSEKHLNGLWSVS